MRKAIKTLAIILLAVTAFILKPTDTRAEGTGKEYTHNLVEEAEQEISSIGAEETSTLKETTTEKETVDDAAQITPTVTYGEIIIAAFIAFLSGICCVLIFVFTLR